MNKYAIIVAGGSGSRMGTSIPKQFILLTGIPILMHTLKAFYQYDKAINIILVLPEEQIKKWRSLCQKYNFDVPHEIVTGGKTRFHSVKNGLSTISGEGLVAVHDGVRPLVSGQVIEETYSSAKKYRSAVAATPLKESIRKINRQDSKAIDRSQYRLVQTPQTFYVSDLKKAYTIDYTPDITDDASIIERAGIKIHLTSGSYENIKITTPEDLLLAEAIVNKRNKKR